MSASNFRKQLHTVLAALHGEREQTQKEHFELRRLIAAKQNDKAIALLNEMFEREAAVLAVLSRIEYLQVQEALEIIDKGLTTK